MYLVVVNAYVGSYGAAPKILGLFEDKVLAEDYVRMFINDIKKEYEKFKETKGGIPFCMEDLRYDILEIHENSSYSINLEGEYGDTIKYDGDFNESLSLFSHIE